MELEHKLIYLFLFGILVCSMFLMYFYSNKIITLSLMILDTLLFLLLVSSDEIVWIIEEKRRN